MGVLAWWPCLAGCSAQTQRSLPACWPVPGWLLLPQLLTAAAAATSSSSSLVSSAQTNRQRQQRPAAAAVNTCQARAADCNLWPSRRALLQATTTASAALAACSHSGMRPPGWRQSVGRSQRPGCSAAPEACAGSSALLLLLQHQLRPPMQRQRQARSPCRARGLRQTSRRQQCSRLVMHTQGLLCLLLCRGCRCTASPCRCRRRPQARAHHAASSTCCRRSRLAVCGRLAGQQGRCNVCWWHLVVIQDAAAHSTTAQICFSHHQRASFLGACRNASTRARSSDIFYHITSTVI